MKSLRKILGFILLFIVVFNYVCNVSINAETGYIQDDNIIKVGYIDYDGFINYKKGKYTGYGVEVLNEISNYTNWKYEYIYDTWENCLKKLENNEIDFICTAQSTVNRKEKFIFSKYSIGTENSMIYTLPNKNIYYEDYENMDGKKVGLLKESYQTEMFFEYADKHNFKYEEILFDTETELVDALKNGEVDLVGAGSLARHKELKIVGKFGADPFYIMINKEKLDLKEEVDNVLDKIFNINPFFISELTEKYYSIDKTTSTPMFTREEMKYIKNSDVITIGNVISRIPMSYYNQETEKMDGILISVMEKISKKSGLKFKYKGIKENKRLIDALSSNEVDLVAGVSRILDYTEDSNIILSDVIVTSELVLVTKKGTSYNLNAPYSIAVLANFENIQRYVKENFSKWSLVIKKNNTEQLDAIINGEVNFAIQNVYAAGYNLQNPKYSDLITIKDEKIVNEQSCIAGLSDKEMLIYIINKSLAVISQDEINDIILQYSVSNSYTPTLSDILFEYKFSIRLVFLLILLLVALFLIILGLKQKLVHDITQKNAQLSIAIEEAKNANNYKNKFLANMSQEIKTPLNSIIGTLHLLDDNIPNTDLKQKTYLNKILLLTDILSNVLNNILDMSAIDNNRIRIAYEKFSLKQVINSLTSIYYTQCVNKKIEFRIILKDINTETYIGDAVRINQILINIMSNAVKYTDNGGKIILEIDERFEDDERDYLEFKVIDNGCGIDDNLQDRIFLPFERGDGKIYNGSGLGLSVAYNLVTLMRGTIDFKSIKNKGTEFKVTIPLAKLDFCDEYENEIINKNTQVIVIDDEIEICYYCENILKRLNVDYKVIYNSESILKVLEKVKELEDNLKVFIIGENLKKFNVIDLINTIKNNYNEAFIVVSTYDIAYINQKIQSTKINKFLLKPIFKSDIYECINMPYLDELKRNKLDFSEYRILLAEDSRFNEEILLNTLSITGLNIDKVDTKEEVISTFENSEPYKYDLILVDIQTQEYDLEEFIYNIRKLNHKNSHSIPIIIVIDDINSPLLDNIKYKLDDYIKKPINIKKIYECLSKWFIINRIEK